MCWLVSDNFLKSLFSVLLKDLKVMQKQDNHATLQMFTAWYFPHHSSWVIIQQYHSDK